MNNSNLDRGIREGLNTETTPLLAGENSRTSDRDVTSNFQVGHENPYVAESELGPAKSWKVYPVAFGVYIAMAIVMTTTVEIMRRLSCQFWYAVKDPGRLPPGMIPADSELCKIAAVEVLFSKVINFEAVVDAVGTLISFALVGKYGDKYGRRNLFLVICTLQPIATACLLLAFLFHSNPYVQLTLLLFWYILLALGHPKVVLLMCSMYVVDTTRGPAERTHGLTMLTGAMIAGLAPSLALGGAITKYTQNALSVYRISICISIITYLYIIFFLPESYTSKSQSNSSTSEQPPAAKSIRESMGSIFLPVKKLLTPQRNTSNGRLNFRLVYVSAVVLFATLGSAYISLAWIIYMTTRFDMKPDQTGLSASVVAFAKVFFMFLIFPRILSLRPYFNRKFLHREHASEVGETTSSQFDVVVAFLSLLVEATAVSMFGFAKNPVQLVMLFALQVLGSGNIPALQSIAVASVDHSESGLVLSGLQIVVSIAEVGSTVGMGAILSATIVTMPWVMFVVCGGMMTIAALLLLLVRDSDRWKED